METHSNRAARWVITTNLYGPRYSGVPIHARKFRLVADIVGKRSFSCIGFGYGMVSRVWPHTWACVKSSCTNTHTQVWSERKEVGEVGGDST